MVTKDPKQKNYNFYVRLSRLTTRFQVRTQGTNTKHPRIRPPKKVTEEERNETMHIKIIMNQITLIFKIQLHSISHQLRSSLEVMHMLQ